MDCIYMLLGGAVGKGGPKITGTPSGKKRNNYGVELNFLPKKKKKKKGS